MRKVIWFAAASILMAGMAYAQEGQRIEQNQRMVGPGKREQAPEPKITKEDRARAMQMLESAEGQARGIEDGSSRAFALLQLARAYQATDKKKAVGLLEEAFTASKAASEQMSPQVKRAANMQLQQILLALIPLAPEKVNELLPQIDAQPRERVVTELLGYYVKNHQTDRALEMIYRIGQEKEIPYGAASRLMGDFGPEQDDQRQQLFTTALASYRDHQADHAGFAMGSGDFGTLITQYCKQLPPSLVMQAIDVVLEQARKTDTAAKDKEGPATISLASSKGAVQLNGQYEYGLFQLLPVLRELDPQQAEKLAKEYQTVQTMLAKYPQGVGSLNGDEKNRGSNIVMSSGAPAKMPRGGPGSGGPNPLEMQRMQKIMEDAEAHPQDALANALTLNSPTMKTEALIAIARAAGKKNIGVANSALAKAQESAQQMEDIPSTMSLRDIASTYLVLEENDEAKKAVEKGIAAAAKTYKTDTDADDPNQAPKPYWPSAAGFRNMMMLAVKISPMFAQEQLKEIPDEDIRTIARIGLAESLLQIRGGETAVMTFTKDSARMMVMEDQQDKR